MFFRQCGIKHRKVVPYSPQSNGLIERFNRTLKKAIQTANSEGRIWQETMDSFLDYRTTVHPSTNCSPARLIFGQEIRTSIPGTLNIDHRSSDQAVYKRNKKYKKKMKEYFDKNMKVGECDKQQILKLCPE